MISTMILIAGLGQLILVVASLAIPRALNWSEDVAKLRPLNRQVFWTYAAYIWATNLSFAIISIASPSSLIDQTFLATAVTVYITVYWLARVVIQFAYFDRSDSPQGAIFVVGEFLLVALFVFLVGVYGSAVAANFYGPT